MRKNQKKRMKKTKPKDPMADAFMKFAEKEWGVKFKTVVAVDEKVKKNKIRTLK